MVKNWPDWILEDLPRMVSVDVEAAGPNPADYALLSIGACTLVEPRRFFYVELKPVVMRSEPGSVEIHQLNLDELARTGEPPGKAMQFFTDWLEESVLTEKNPLFVGFNAPFDWMFVCDYFHRFYGSNPFGHSALDVKSFYMGLARVDWSLTSMSKITTKALRHNALEDACDQAALFKKIVLDSRT